MKIYLVVFYFISIALLSQNSGIDSLLYKVQSQQIDRKTADKAMNLPYDKIANNLNSSLLIFESIVKCRIYANDSISFGDLVEKLGLIHYLKGDYQKSSKRYLEAISLFEAIGDEKRRANAMAKLAYQSKSRNLKSSIKLMSQAIEILKKSKDASYDLSGALDNYGVLFEIKGELDTALFYYQAALKIKNSNKDSIGIPYSLNNIAGVYFAKNEINKGLIYFNQSSIIREKLKDDMGIAENENSLGELYLSLNNINLAKIHFQKSKSLCKKVSYIDLLGKNLRALSLVYSKERRFDSAYYYYNMFFNIHDSLYNGQRQKEILEMETVFETEKQEKEKQVLQSQNLLSENTIKQQRIISYFIVGGLVIVSFLAFFIFNGLRKQRRANHIISLQKLMVVEKHKEITDSINYAERIQRSFLATKEHLDSNLNEYFILFKPKDVVSGDFYWSATLNNNLFALVTADSTGHGVPGAIMSLLNIGGIEKAIETNTQPADILNSTRKTIIDRLKKDGSPEGGKDGMDASFTVYDFKNKKLTIAAANNPVWIIRGSETIEIKPDKMPIGKHNKDNISFTQQEIDLQTGDVVYTLTDGFPDQFGGPNGKKFMSKNLRELLAANAHLPMAKQKHLLEKTFADWIGNMEQVDDVCLIGIKI